MASASSRAASRTVGGRGVFSEPFMYRSYPGVEITTPERPLPGFESGGDVELGDARQARARGRRVGQCLTANLASLMSGAIAGMLVRKGGSVGRRAVIVVLDGVGAGGAPDAARFGDEGSNTLGNTARAVGGLNLRHLGALGLGNVVEIEGVPPAARAEGPPAA